MAAAAATGRAGSSFSFLFFFVVVFINKHFLRIFFFFFFSGRLPAHFTNTPEAQRSPECCGAGAVCSASHARFHRQQPKKNNTINKKMHCVTDRWSFQRKQMPGNSIESRENRSEPGKRRPASVDNEKKRRRARRRWRNLMADWNSLGRTLRRILWPWPSRSAGKYALRDRSALELGNNQTEQTVNGAC